MYKIINSDPEPLAEDIPESVKSFLAKALSKDPQQRFQSASEFEDELYELREHLNTHTNSQHDLDTGQLQQMDVFENCDIEILRELAGVVDCDDISAGELFIGEQDSRDVYICVVHGKAELTAGEKKLTISSGQWLVGQTLSQGLGTFSCQALSDCQILRVSKAGLLVSSSATQAYFYQFMLERFFLRSN